MPAAERNGPLDRSLPSEPDFGLQASTWPPPTRSGPSRTAGTAAAWPGQSVCPAPGSHPQLMRPWPRDASMHEPATNTAKPKQGCQVQPQLSNLQRDGPPPIRRRQTPAPSSPRQGCVGPSRDGEPGNMGRTRAPANHRGRFAARSLQRLAASNHITSRTAPNPRIRARLSASGSSFAVRAGLVLLSARILVACVRRPAGASCWGFCSDLWAVAAAELSTSPL